MKTGHLIYAETKYNACMDGECPHIKECSQHHTAGDFRSDEGFTPELFRLNGEFYCETYYKKNVDSLPAGMLRFSDVKEQNFTRRLQFDRPRRKRLNYAK